MELSVLWWLNHFGIFFPGTLMSYISTISLTRWASRVGRDLNKSTRSLEMETWEEKSIRCNNLWCECKSIFTPEHFISCGSPNFLPNCMQFGSLRNWSLANLLNVFAKLTKIITLREGEVPEGLIFLMILNSTKCSYMQIFLLYLLEALEFF